MNIEGFPSLDESNIYL